MSMRFGAGHSISLAVTPAGKVQDTCVASPASPGLRQ